MVTESIRKQQTNPKKIYSIDNGLSLALRPPSRGLDEIPLGHFFENQIHLDLKRTGFTIHYCNTRSGHEIDFIAQRGLEPLRAFQVSLDPKAAQEVKEVQAALELKSELGVEVFHVHPDSYRDFWKEIAGQGELQTGSARVRQL